MPHDAQTLGLCCICGVGLVSRHLWRSGKCMAGEDHAAKWYLASLAPSITTTDSVQNLKKHSLFDHT